MCAYDLLSGHLKRLCVWDFVLPFDVEKFAETVHVDVEVIELSRMTLINGPVYTGIEESGVYTALYTMSLVFRQSPGKILTLHSLSELTSSTFIVM